MISIIIISRIVVGSVIMVSMIVIIVVPSVIIVMPSVAKVEIEAERRVPAVPEKRIITPVIIASEIRIVPVVAAISIIIIWVIIPI